MSRTRNTLGPLIGYHGCSREVAEKVLAGKEHLKKSENGYDWLGSGIYFWADSPDRAWAWAEQQQKRKGWKEAAVVGAFINPGLCLNLTDFGVNDSLISAYSFMKTMFDGLGFEMAKNESKENGIFMKRSLDCSVIDTLHQIRRDEGEPAYDTVYGVFEEGDELFPGSGFKSKTHIQIAVRNPELIIGYFRVT